MVNTINIILWIGIIIANIMFIYTGLKVPKEENKTLIKGEDNMESIIKLVRELGITIHSDMGHYFIYIDQFQNGLYVKMRKEITCELYEILRKIIYQE